MGNMEVLELTFPTTRMNVAIQPGFHPLSFGSDKYPFGDKEPLGERNRRLRYAADQFGRELTNSIIAKLNEMGHAV